MFLCADQFDLLMFCVKVFRVCIHEGYLSVLSFSALGHLVWYHSNTGLIKWNAKCLLPFLDEFL
jgi:hypothetical protein